jgi:hypothetical protein
VVEPLDFGVFATKFVLKVELRGVIAIDIAQIYKVL